MSQHDSEIEEVVNIHKFQYQTASEHRKVDNDEMARLNYITSRIRAILCAFLLSETDNALWWWIGLQNELVR